MGENYLINKNTVVDLTRYKSRQKDRISFGQVENLSKEDRFATKELNNLFDSDAFIVNEDEELNSFTQKEIETSFIKIGDIISRVVAAFLPITLFVLFFNYIKNGFFENSIQISPSVLSMIGLYLVFFAVSVLWLSRKKKIKLSIKNNYLHLSSFPTFYQKINLENVNSCYVNAFNHPSDQFDYLTAEIRGNFGNFSVNIESGVALFLKNGKKIVIGTSNSLKYYQEANLQLF